MDTEKVTSRMFDFDSFYERMANELPDNCRVCEVGVADGESALFLANRLHRLGKRFKLYMVDNMDYGQYNQIVTIYKNIIKSGLGEFIEVIPQDSISASGLFNDNYLDFAYIDTSHEYQETKDSIRAWYPKLKDERILAGHDYIGHEEVKLAVDEVLPSIITRNDIPDRVFEPEKFLHIEDTNNGFGLWWVKKDFYKHINL